MGGSLGFHGHVASEGGGICLRGANAHMARELGSLEKLAENGMLKIAEWQVIERQEERSSQLAAQKTTSAVPGLSGCCRVPEQAEGLAGSARKP